MEPISTLTAAKELSEVAKSIEKVYNVSKEMKTVAEFEGKDQLMVPKDLSGTATNMGQGSRGEWGGFSGKDLKKSNFVDTIEQSQKKLEPTANSVVFVDKLSPNNKPIDIHNIKDVFVDRLDSHESADAIVNRKGGDSNESQVKNDGLRKLNTRNQSLEGQNHPETGVPYERKAVSLDTGEKAEGVFPQFDSKFDVQLPEELEKETDSKQSRECNRQLKEKCESDPEFRKQFTEDQLDDIEHGQTPEGYTWHHSEEKGKMQLVEYNTHSRTPHTGGRSLWGGGSECR